MAFGQLRTHQYYLGRKLINTHSLWKRRGLENSSWKKVVSRVQGSYAYHPTLIFVPLRENKIFSSIKWHDQTFISKTELFPGHHWCHSLLHFHPRNLRIPIVFSSSTFCYSLITKSIFWISFTKCFTESCRVKINFDCAPADPSGRLSCWLPCCTCWWKTALFKSPSN